MKCGAARQRGRCHVLDVVTVLVGTPVLLIRMRAQLLRTGRLGTTTAVWMWTTYAAWARLFVCLLNTPPRKPPAPPWARPLGLGIAVTGGALDVAGAHRFAGPAQLTGTDAGELITGGIYRYSRHPQYTGIVLVLTGLAINRRSPPALALTAGAAMAYRLWVPTEERHLVQHFGDAYRRYSALTPRWLGRPHHDDDPSPASTSRRGPRQPAA